MSFGQINCALSVLAEDAYAPLWLQMPPLPVQIQRFKDDLNEVTLPKLETTNQLYATHSQYILSYINVILIGIVLSVDEGSSDLTRLHN